MAYYFDYAATSAVRPSSVVDAVRDFLQDSGATPGRGGYARALDAGRTALRARRRAMEVLGLVGDPTRLALLPNATHALNTALYGFLGERDVAVTTVFDHNAVLRPLHHLSKTRGVDVRLVSGTPDGDLDWEGLERALNGAELLALNEVSNVLGTRLPVSRMCEMAHAAGVTVLVDAAQSAGHVVETLGADGADMVAFTGHKGMLGPQGTGGLWLREGLSIEPWVRGGTGGASEDREMPLAMPDRLEAGTANVPGLAGLVAGCVHLLDEGVENIHAREAKLKKRLREGLQAIPRVEVLSPAAPEGVGIVTVRTPSLESGELAERLDRDFGVAARSGLHCAPEAHRLVGSLETGALRFSIGWATEAHQVDHVLEAVQHILKPTTVPV